MTQCRQESLRVTVALLEALGVPQQAGLPANVCLARLLDVEAFLRGNAHGTSMLKTPDPSGKSPPPHLN